MTARRRSADRNSPPPRSFAYALTAYYGSRPSDEEIDAAWHNGSLGELWRLGRDSRPTHGEGSGERDEWRVEGVGSDDALDLHAGLTVRVTGEPLTVRGIKSALMDALDLAEDTPVVRVKP